ncbi:MAG: ABC transporter ATP-binding protein, partial [Ruminococcus sp.]|nr:ABC transporter ATP-binding protein [Ruminococcus sp.]
IADRSILIISHQERILNIADEIIVLNSGEIDKQGDKDKILPELIGTPAAVKNCQGVNKEV